MAMLARRGTMARAMRCFKVKVWGTKMSLPWVDDRGFARTFADQKRFTDRRRLLSGFLLAAENYGEQPVEAKSVEEEIENQDCNHTFAMDLPCHHGN